MADLINISDQFQGLPMESLIGGPLQAAVKSQLLLASSTADFIKTIGFEPDGKKARMVNFSFTRPNQDAKGQLIEEIVELNVPMLSIVNVPSLMIDTVDITFDMEVKSSTSSKETEDTEASLDAHAKVGYGIFSLDVNIHGKVSTHKENTRSSDNSAKYHVEVHASQAGMPEGLGRVLDILATSVAPSKISQTAQPNTPTAPAN